MKSKVESFGGHQQDKSRTATIQGHVAQGGLVFSICLAGCLSLSVMHGAVALPKSPNLPAHAVVSSVSSLPHEIYYYRGRYYPYRYRGAYYGHRYYRYGRWHYY